MSVYEGGDSTVNNTDLTQNEIDLYGSSRLGVYNVAIDVQNCTVPNDSLINFTEGNKFFELTNHLGNVLATVSDKRMEVDSSTDTTLISYYTANVVTANDYYPFGMEMPGRQFLLDSSARFRYGFNGQEHSNEVGGEDYTAAYWENDGRIGRRWDVDPKPNAGISVYNCFSGNPISYTDTKGDTNMLLEVMQIKPALLIK
jgi:RHS repeat-associated protein